VDVFSTRPSRGHWRFALSALLVVLALGALSACGSSDDSNATAGAASTTGGDAGGGDVVAAAKTKYEAAIKGPTEFTGPTEPVPAKKGIKVGILTCDSKLSGCTNGGKAMAKVVEQELGGTTKTYDGQSNPKTWNEAILQMVADNVDAIALLAIPPPLAGQGLAAAKAKGIPVVRCCGGGGTPNEEPDTNGQVFASVDIDYAAAGKASAAYVASSSGGKANVMVLNDKSQGAVNAHVTAFEEELKAICPDCKQDEVATTTADVTTATPDRTVAYLRAHPDVDWIYLGYDPQGAFIIPAMQKAGITKVKVAGILGNPQNVDFIKKGVIQQSDIMIDEDYYGWALTDQVLRAIAKQPAAEPKGEGSPFSLVTKDAGNFPTTATDSTGWTAPFDYPGAYRKLWGLQP
jgi:ribose transport system substrate-binding protein